MKKLINTIAYWWLKRQNLVIVNKERILTLSQSTYMDDLAQMKIRSKDELIAHFQREAGANFLHKILEMGLIKFSTEREVERMGETLHSKLMIIK